MDNKKILEMINDGKIEELKTILREEIFTDELKKKPGVKQRYVAMKKYFTYTNSHGNKMLEMPCLIDFCSEQYTSFTNGYSIVLTKESCGEIKLYENPKSYIKVKEFIVFEGKQIDIDANRILAEAKGKGYKLKKSEVEINSDCKYALYCNGLYFKIGLLDACFSIINDDSPIKAWIPSKYGNKSPIIMQNDIGYCFILPFNPFILNKDKKDITIIEV